MSTLFAKRIVDLFGKIGVGATAPDWVRADDGLSYVAKDEGGGAASVRASEYIWTSIARLVGIPAPVPEIILNAAGRALFCTRREQSAVDANSAQMALFAGRVSRGGTHLS